MKLLLDTHTLIWTLFQPESLSTDIKTMISDPKNDIFVSVASFWEAEVKHVKRPDLMPFDSKVLQSACGKARFSIIPITPRHIEFLGSFVKQNIHKDPFDHMLLATAMADQFVLLTHDGNIGRYQNAPVLPY